MALFSKNKDNNKASAEDAQAFGKKATSRAVRDAKKNAPSKAQVKREHKEKMGKVAKYVLVAIGCAAMLLSVTAMACSGVLNQVSSGGDSYHLTGGVAAEVNGVNITEDTVTKQIMSTRESGGYDTDEAWATYLSSQGQTPETLRESTIDSLARQYLITRAIQDYDIVVTDEEIDDGIASQAEAYGMSADDYISQLTAFGDTEDTLRQSVESSLAQQKLRDKVAPLEDPSDQEIIDYVNQNLDTLNDARRSSHILFKVDSDATDEERADAQAKAQEVLDKLNAGEIKFADAAKEYSEDSSARDGGDVGWDKLTTFVSTYQDALSQLGEGQMSGIVETDYGYHIILCTGYFHVDGEVTSIDQIPEDLRKTISDTLASQNQSTAYNDWVDQYVEDADIQINEMPADVPYNVDMSLAETDDAATTDDAAATDGSADAGATDDAAATE